MFNPKKEKMNYTGFLFIALIFLASCKKDDHDEAAQLEKDIATIQKYLTDNG